MKYTLRGAVGRTDHSNRTSDVIARLRQEGWAVARNGPGDHVQYKHPTKLGRVTIDASAREIPTGTLRSIFRQAGWEW
jgi:predicted RNA binding protein YcfA (HicA-like mRNA interferase family)